MGRTPEKLTIEHRAKLSQAQRARVRRERKARRQVEAALKRAAARHRESV